MSRSRRRFLAAVVVAGVLALLVGLVAMAVRSGTPRTVILANGPILHLLGITYGTNHATPGVIRWRSYLPAPVRGFFGGGRPGMRFTRPEPSLVLWFKEDALARSNRVARTGVVGLLADEEGVLAGNEDWLSLRPPGAPATSFHMEFRVVPKRSRRLTLLLFDEGGGSERARLGELAFRNPAYDEWPQWTPETLPVTRADGDLECDLSRLVAGVGYHTISRSGAVGSELEFVPATPGHRPNAVGLFTFREAGVLSSDWTVGTIRLADATGNQLRCGSSSHQILDDRVALRFGPILWPDEVWELTVWAKRTAEAPFSDAERIVCEDVAVPPLRGTNRLGRSFEPIGIPVTVEEFVHQPPPSPGGYSMRDLTHLSVSVAELPEGHYLDIVQIEDEEGRELKSRGWSLSHGTPARMVFAFERVPEGARRLTIRLVLQQGRAFVFRVRPERVLPDGLILPEPVERGD